MADELQKDQVYEFAKSAGLKEDEVEFVGRRERRVQRRSWRRPSRPATRPTSSGSTSRTSSSSGARATWSTSTDLGREDAEGAQGHLRGHPEARRLKGRRHRRAPGREPVAGARAARSPREGQGRLSRRRGTSSSRPARRSRSRPASSPSASVSGWSSDTTDNVMNLLWCYGGKMVEEDNKTIVMNSAENIAGVKVHRGDVQDPQDHPPGAISWDNSGNNKAYQSKQAAFVMNPTQRLRLSRRQRQGSPEGRPGSSRCRPAPRARSTRSTPGRSAAFKKSPYPELAKGLHRLPACSPPNYDKIIQSTGGRWVPVYKRLFDSPFWREKPAFKHFIQMAETGVPVSYAGSPTPAAGEVLNTHVIPKMIQRVLVENWQAEKAARGVPQEDRGDLRPARQGLGRPAAARRDARGEPRGSPLPRPPILRKTAQVQSVLDASREGAGRSGPRSPTPGVIPSARGRKHHVDSVPSAAAVNSK